MTPPAPAGSRLAAHARPGPGLRLGQPVCGGLVPLLHAQRHCPARLPTPSPPRRAPDRGSGLLRGTVPACDSNSPDVTRWCHCTALLHYLCCRRPVFPSVTHRAGRATHSVTATVQAHRFLPAPLPLTLGLVRPQCHGTSACSLRLARPCQTCLSSSPAGVDVAPTHWQIRTSRPDVQ